MIEPKFVRNTENPFNYDVSHVCGCGNLVTATVADTDVFHWRRGLAAQVAFKELSAPLREALFISGVCPSCWEALMVEDDEPA